MADQNFENLEEERVSNENIEEVLDEEGLADEEIALEDEETEVDNVNAEAADETVMAGSDIVTTSFGELRAPPDAVEGARTAFQTFLDGSSSREAAGEAVWRPRKHPPLTLAGGRWGSARQASETVVTEAWKLWSLDPYTAA
jgi:hypothetical protein